MKLIPKKSLRHDKWFACIRRVLCRDGRSSNSEWLEKFRPSEQHLRFATTCLEMKTCKLIKVLLHGVFLWVAGFMTTWLEMKTCKLITALLHGDFFKWWVSWKQWTLERLLGHVYLVFGVYFAIAIFVFSYSIGWMQQSTAFMRSLLAHVTCTFHLLNNFSGFRGEFVAL